MIVRVKLFAVARQLVGAATAELEVPAPATVAQVRAALVAKYPKFADCDRHVVFAVNGDYAGDDSRIPDNAEVACIPPVSGG